MKIRVICCFFLLFGFFTSCHTPSYSFIDNSTVYGIDFREGKWLMNRIDAPAGVRDKLTEVTTKRFSDRLGHNFYDLKNAKGIIIPGNLTMNPSKMDIENLKIGTGFDYFINIKATSVRNEIGPMQIGPIRNMRKNQAEVVLEIYDLNSLDIIYRQHIVGTVSVENDNKDFALTKGSHSLMVGGLKKILKKIEKTSL